MSGISQYVDQAKEYVDSGISSARDYVTNDLPALLDFGGNPPPPQTAPTTARARELNTQTIDRTNPTALQETQIFGLPKPVVYIGGAVMAIVLLKVTKVI